MTEASAAHPRDRRSRPWLAAILSFVVPGIGQLYAGRLRLGIVFVLPIVLLALAVVAVVGGALSAVRNSLFSSEVLTALLVLNGALLAWRGAAIAHAGLTPWDRIQGHDRRTSLMVVGTLLFVTFAMHAWVGALVLEFNDTLAQVFEPQQPSTRSGGEPSDDDDAGEPVNQPTFEWDGTERINILLLGTDAAPGRDTVLTDVLLVVSVDPVANTAEMISIPRDTGFVPLPDETLFPGALYPDKVNELALQASLAPETWCPDIADDPEACGLRTIERSIGLYLGLEIHHYALVDMAGFADMIDAIGGVDLCLPGRLVDPEFDGTLENAGSTDGLILPAGCRRYGGLDALAYARSRQGWIEMPDGERVPQNDFERGERQQQVLLAMRKELAEADTFLELPNLLRAIARTVDTDFPRARAGDLASLLPLIAGPDIDRLVLGYPEFVDLPVNPGENYLLIPKRDAIREEMADLFGADALQGWYLGSTDDGPGEDPAAGLVAP